ncbi:hypothetical protein F0562_008992 [Nyssa sinensis]|uniref:Uncharacterized protein n=1 Tax=Nyssa sinensis TaxID=561372 RepID=A0A5J5A8Y2_9ASTE|nr:hypothetical protein F0562_008992 [Nyssa sinensis]
MRKMGSKSVFWADLEAAAAAVDSVNLIFHTIAAVHGRLLLVLFGILPLLLLHVLKLEFGFDLEDVLVADTDDDDDDSSDGSFPHWYSLVLAFHSPQFASSSVTATTLKPDTAAPAYSKGPCHSTLQIPSP